MRSPPERYPSFCTIRYRKYARIHRCPSPRSLFIIHLFLPLAVRYLHLHPPLPLSYSSSLLILLATRSIRKLCDRSLSCSFKRHISISPNFLHKRLGEENIRRQWVNIQSLISKIAGNRSRHCQLQRCDASWCRDEERLEKGSLGNKANKEK